MGRVVISVSPKKGKETGFLEAEIPFNSLSYPPMLRYPPSAPFFGQNPISFPLGHQLSSVLYLEHSGLVTAITRPVGGVYHAPPNSLRAYLGHSVALETQRPKRELLTCVQEHWMGAGGFFPSSDGTAV